MNCVRTLCASHGLHKCVPLLKNIASRSCAAAGTSFVSNNRVYALVHTNRGLNRGLNRSLNLQNLTRTYCSSSAAINCWNCGSSPQLFFCPACKVIQPPNEGATYFEILNCDQTFALDVQQLQRRYLELQRSLHPDNFSLKSSTERGYSERQSALVNKAFRTLQKPLTRAVYMLQLRGVELGEGTDATADPNFLLEVMEVNEKLAESRSREDVNAIGQAVRETLKDLTEQMNTSLNKGDLQSAKDLLARMKYFANLEEKVKEKLTENL
ncbi:iron-sulfur cluster co-chaperone protein HscB isoform X2 [Salminus brasiliensis]|uniref:iron-sulfur cluster co-chaperone protein HscB isoform X2 n=1 Tax=Salminus brasiliensis TaxID=930266 RepID=UPI003B831CC6